MFSLKCDYYKKSFETIDDLISDVVSSGMDPNYNITENGKDTEEQLINFIIF
jgi:hypothetical protein